VRVEVRYQGKKMAFVRGEDKSTWYFDEPERGEVNLERWSGVPLLLSGPRSKRLLEWTPNPAKLPEYGFNRPLMEIDLGIEGGGSGTILLGDKTPDGGAYYLMIKGYTPLYLVDYTWVDVIGRLVTEPPRLTGTPTPTPP
ncbi:MAG: DUF4340 domain-containing protein, partial [Chloroflexota bacterium]|nr:DUF4340 domain-containing protein [Chloroflexota bacterium]